MTKVKNDLFDYKNMYIYQNEEDFKFSLDSVLLSEYVNLNPRIHNILDFCTGNAPVPLILSTKTSANIVGFEIQKEIYELGIDSVLLNKKEKQIKLINDNIKNIQKYYSKNYFDVITCNPPYFKVNETSIVNGNKKLSIARHEIELVLEDIFVLSSQYLKDNGVLYMVHRSERIDEMFILANKYGMNIKNMQLIATNDDMKPYLVLIKCVKNSKFGVKISPTLNINGLKTYQNIFGGVK